MKIMPQSWFEMPEEKKRVLDKSVWIPLKASKVLIREGKFGELDYIEEYFGVGSIAVPVKQRVQAEKLGWVDIGARNPDRGYVEKGKYTPAYVYKDLDKNIVGEKLVLERAGNPQEPREWHLNQDLICTLELKSEGDSWLAISRGYEEASKIERNADGKVVGLYIKASYLKDYLCSRKMALYVTSYRSRRQVVQDRSHIKWEEPNVTETANEKWQGYLREVDEHGRAYGSTFAVFHESRTDVDFDEDIPELGFPTENNVEAKSWEGKYEGSKRYYIEGEFWRKEWVEPSAKSYIVNEEETEATAFFITDNNGKRENKDTLVNGIRWLWFEPSVVNAILAIRGSSLGWYTADTGTISCSPGYGLHFGINKIGLINILAKDIALLPDWQQKIFAGHNCSPDGKVSAELLMSQMKAKPASTQAPEEFVTKGIFLLDEIVNEQFGIRVFKNDVDVGPILKQIHRFRANEAQGIFELAKDLYRIFGERIDTKAIKAFIKPKKGEEWGELKSLEKLLAARIGAKPAFDLVSPMWGVYKLRIVASHLPSAQDIKEGYILCKVNQKELNVVQAYELIDSFVTCVYNICKVLKPEIAT